jgi:hypothetical protein
MSKSFYSWLLQFKNDDTSVGDLAREAISDKGFPRHSVSRKHLRDFLESMNACDNVMCIFEEAFTRYEKDAK